MNSIFVFDRSRLEKRQCDHASTRRKKLYENGVIIAISCSKCGEILKKHQKNT